MFTRLRRQILPFNTVETVAIVGAILIVLLSILLLLATMFMPAIPEHSLLLSGPTPTVEQTTVNALSSLELTPLPTDTKTITTPLLDGLERFLLIILIAAIAIFFIIRELITWYFKLSKIVSLLREISNKLTDIKASSAQINAVVTNVKETAQDTTTLDVAPGHNAQAPHVTAITRL